MARKGYIIDDQQSMYYLTFTVVGWIDIFTRQSYRDIVIESLKHCQQNKNKPHQVVPLEFISLKNKNRILPNYDCLEN